MVLASLVGLVAREVLDHHEKRTASDGDVLLRDAGESDFVDFLGERHELGAKGAPLRVRKT